MHRVRHCMKKTLMGLPLSPLLVSLFIENLDVSVKEGVSNKLGPLFSQNRDRNCIVVVKKDLFNQKVFQGLFLDNSKKPLL